MDPPLSPVPFFAEFKKDLSKHTLLLSFQSLGVVYGQLSTAPLYVFGAISAKDRIKSDEAVYELFSFIFWTMTLLSLLKYAFMVLRADDSGEGGPFALYSLLCRHAKVGLLPTDRCANEVMNFESELPFKIKSGSRVRRAIEKYTCTHYFMLFLALFGSCMVICDGVFNPAISVLSASKGLQRSLSDMSDLFSSSPSKQKSISDAFRRYVSVPSACIILVGLFTLQHYGTHKIGSIFAPIITTWILFIGGVGLYNIFVWDHQIIYAISPTYLYHFVRNADFKSWRSLGSIILCVAGSEAMFADLGHFSKKSIKITFVFFVYPVLVLCYAGQAAFISKNWHTNNNFTHLSESVPKPVRHIFIVLSLLAAAVGSQATITASFSIINQCLALDCFPRVKVIHTSDKIHGQVYIPDVNWLLMVLSLAITIGFHDIVGIGNATGLAIICGMLVTTCLMSLVIVLYWEHKFYIAACFFLLFSSVEAMYLSANILNFHKGAWSLVALLALSFTIMLSWHYGTMKKYKFDLENKVSMDWLTDLSPGLGVSRVSGIGFIYTDVMTGIPAFFSHFITNLPAFHEVLIFVSFKSLPVPYVPPTRRYLVGRIGPKEYKIYRCIVRYGYCDCIRDTDNFEDQIIRSIGEFISMENNDLETLPSSEGRLVVVGNPNTEGNALIPLNESDSTTLATHSNIESQRCEDDLSERYCATFRTKKVRFALPTDGPKMRESVRKGLQELVNARESGTAYFLGQSHFTVRAGSNLFKRLVVMIYVFLDKNCREPPVALDIPHAALVEVGMVYTI